jgi:glycosyltransferase involved in cell wall biosynthesis
MNPTHSAQQKIPLISIVTPFFNEGLGVELFHRAMSSALDGIADFNFEFVCVDDGSTDQTLLQLQKISELDKRFTIIELSRNFGKEAALTAGLDAARGDAVIPIDSDLQDPPEIIPAMIREWQKGVDVVLGRRSNRLTDTALKRTTANLFYRVHNFLSPIEIPSNVGDFRLMDRAVVEALKQLPEQFRFMKGLFAWVGFRTGIIEYARQSRAAGKTKFSGWKLWNFAIEGITSFSTAPLRVWTYIGVVIGLLSLLYAGIIITRTLTLGVDVPGYASLLVAVLFLGSLQLISIGILGEYVGRIYIESKRRPRYVVRRTYGSS